MPEIIQFNAMGGAALGSILAGGSNEDSGEM